MDKERNVMLPGVQEIEFHYTQVFESYVGNCQELYGPYCYLLLKEEIMYVEYGECDAQLVQRLNVRL